MKSLLVTVFMLTTPFANAATICTNAGNFNGSYYVDISGYKKLVDGSIETLEATLSFKLFRSRVNLIDTLFCSKSAANQSDSAMSLSCKSATGSTAYTVEVLQLNRLVARVANEEIDKSYNEVACRSNE